MRAAILLNNKQRLLMDLSVWRHRRERCIWTAAAAFTVCVTTTSKVNDFINRFKTARLHAEETEDSSEEGPDVCCFRVRSTQVVVGRAMQMG